MKVNDIELIGEETFGAGGFASIRRCALRNIYEDGSRSSVYHADVLLRPKGIDAVVVLPYERTDAGVQVMLRAGLRPALRLGRGDEPPREGGSPPLLLIEAIAGILERGDLTKEGVLRRAAIELKEEGGLRATAEQLQFLGHSVFSLPGLIAERMFFCTVEMPLEPCETPSGDGSPMEHGATLSKMSLPEAIAKCDSGDIADLKTELAVRRLAAELG